MMNIITRRKTATFTPAERRLFRKSLPNWYSPQRKEAAHAELFSDLEPCGHSRQAGSPPRLPQHLQHRSGSRHQSPSREADQGQLRPGLQRRAGGRQGLQGQAAPRAAFHHPVHRGRGARRREDQASPQGRLLRCLVQL